MSFEMEFESKGQDDYEKNMEEFVLKPSDHGEEDG